MTPSVLKQVEEEKAMFPQDFAGPPSKQALIEEVEKLDLPAPKEYLEFAVEFGGCIVGQFPVASLGSVASMGKLATSVSELTRWFRSQEWPGAEALIVFSVDLAGNPIGFDSRGEVWKIDHDAEFEKIKMAESFDGFLRDVLANL